jgi:hypothetical protein
MWHRVVQWECSDASVRCATFFVWVLVCEMETVSSLKMKMNRHQSTRCHIPEDTIFHGRFSVDTQSDMVSAQSPKRRSIFLFLSRQCAVSEKIFEYNHRVFYFDDEL